MTDPQADYSHWHLDKRVPIALIVTLLLQFAGTVYFIGALKAQGDDNTRRISMLESQHVSERLSSVESQLIDTKALLTRIDDKLDRLTERVRKP